jgi:hypothetical protein
MSDDPVPKNLTDELVLWSLSHPLLTLALSSPRVRGKAAIHTKQATGGGGSRSSAAGKGHRQLTVARSRARGIGGSREAGRGPVACASAPRTPVLPPLGEGPAACVSIEYSIGVIDAAGEDIAFLD